jgi:hypothetical protein
MDEEGVKRTTHLIKRMGKTHQRGRVSGFKVSLVLATLTLETLGK